MAKERAQEFLTRCKSLRILIMGDLMVDRYLWGSIDRISPEAPVPVVEIQREESRLGGAANAALNISSMGATPILCGSIGNDTGGEKFLELCGEVGFNTELIFALDSRKTTVKTRIISQGQQVLRVDSEDRAPLSGEENSHVMGQLFDRIPEFDAIIFSDYDKGFLDETLIQMTMVYAQQHNIPVMVDPKFKNFHHFADCTLFKPNLKELKEGLGVSLDKQDFPQIVAAVRQLRESMPHPYTLVTLSDAGMLLIDDYFRYIHLPAHYRNITDVSGAGDTVMSVATLAVAAGLTQLEAAEFANLSGGLVCEEVGVIPIRPERLLDEVIRLQKTQKVS
ncbi:MAG: bifunctional ADP-heptose synthase [Bacteroidota bacterium]